MNPKLLAAALCCTLLLGCGPQPRAPESANRLVPNTDTQNDALRCFPLEAAECRFFVYGDDLLVLTPAENGAMLTRYGGKYRYAAARCELPGMDCTVLTSGTEIYCWLPESQQFWKLNENLETMQKYRMDKPVQGQPILDSDGERIHFCTENAWMVLDTRSGLVRTLRQMETGSWEAAAVSERGVLYCGYAKETGRFTDCLSGEDGAYLRTTQPVLGVSTLGGREILCQKYGSNDCFQLGTALLPLEPGWIFLAFSGEKALVCHPGGELELALYDLNTGRRNAIVRLKTGAAPTQAAVGENGLIWFLMRGSTGMELWQWDSTLSPFREPETSLAPLEETAKSLQFCADWAGILLERYGIQVVYDADAAAVVPEGVFVEAEDVGVYIRAALSRIDGTLRRFPDGFLRTAARGAERVYICIVRTIRENGMDRDSLTFQRDGCRYILLTASDQAGSHLLGALSPLIDNRVLLGSGAFDDWDSLNPAGFQYGGDIPETAAFLSLRGTRSAEADRAELFTAAMTKGNREVFLSAVLQNKLQRMCQGIREAFGLRDYRGKLPWEQYLWER